MARAVGRRQADVARAQRDEPERIRAWQAAVAVDICATTRDMRNAEGGTLRMPGPGRGCPGPINTPPAKQARQEWSSAKNLRAWLPTLGKFVRATPGCPAGPR